MSKALKSPKVGIGCRVLRCEQYPDCLSLAAAEDWISFHCEECTNNDRYPIDFFPEEFEGLDDWSAVGEEVGDFVEIDLGALQPEIDICLIYEGQEIEVCSGL